jgi:pimeloyl-ACP methyl ester carboxylesterase
VPRSLLVVHGALGSAAQLAPVADLLRATVPLASVVCVELPGHGQTSLGGAPFTMATFTDALRDAVSAAAGQSANRPLVFGYSMGGYAALLLEATAPGTFGGIMTLGTMLEWTPTIAAAAASRLDPTVIRAKVPAFAEQLDTRHAAIGGANAMLAQTAALLVALGDAPPLSPARLAAIGCPVSLLVGERDDSVDVVATEALAAGMQRAAVSRLAGVPHPIEKVPLELIVAEVRALLSRVDS